LKNKAKSHDNVRKVAKLLVSSSRKPNDVNQRVREKLDPKRYPNMSAQMAALLGCILLKDFGVTPVISELIVTSDGFLMARDEGDIGFNRFLGAASELRQNWERLVSVAGLAADEHAAAEKMYRDAVQTTVGLH
jgi:hypothetical protein